MAKRKAFTTTIDPEIAKAFRIACVQQDVTMNDVLENFMIRFAAGTLKIELAEKN